jgi:FkbM family methyltransferase
MTPPVLPRLLSLLQPILRDRVFRIRSGPAKGLYRRYGQGFKPRFNKTPEESFLENLDLGGLTVYDVGSYIGMYTLFFARAVSPRGEVIAFEPDPQNFTELKHNIRLNTFDNVRVFHVGVSDRPGEMALKRDPVYPSRSKLVWVPAEKRQEASQEDLIPVDTLDRLQKTHSLPDPDLVKMDVEGSETEVLNGMQEIAHRCKPKLLIEIHEPKPELLRTLNLWGYSIYHLESGRRIEKSAPCKSVSTYHVYCD